MESPAVRERGGDSKTRGHPRRMTWCACKKKNVPRAARAQHFERRRLERTRGTMSSRTPAKTKRAALMSPKSTATKGGWRCAPAPENVIPDRRTSRSRPEKTHPNDPPADADPPPPAFRATRRAKVRKGMREVCKPEMADEALQMVRDRPTVSPTLAIFRDILFPPSARSSAATGAGCRLFAAPKRACRQTALVPPTQEGPPSRPPPGHSPPHPPLARRVLPHQVMDAPDAKVDAARDEFCPATSPPPGPSSLRGARRRRRGSTPGCPRVSRRLPRRRLASPVASRPVPPPTSPRRGRSSSTAAAVAAPTAQPTAGDTRCRRDDCRGGVRFRPGRCAAIRGWIPPLPPPPPPRGGRGGDPMGHEGAHRGGHPALSQEGRRGPSSWRWRRSSSTPSSPRRDEKSPERETPRKLSSGRGLVAKTANVIHISFFTHFRGMEFDSFDARRPRRAPRR